MINLSVSRPPRALIFRARRKKKQKKKQYCPFRFCQILSPWRPLTYTGILALCSIFHADVRRMQTNTISLSLSPSSLSLLSLSLPLSLSLSLSPSLSLSLSLSLSSSSYLFKSIPKMNNADCKNQQKKCLLMRIMMMRSWTACVGIRVGMFILRALFFVFARAHRFAH